MRFFHQLSVLIALIETLSGFTLLNYTVVPDVTVSNNSKPNLTERSFAPTNPRNSKRIPRSARPANVCPPPRPFPQDYTHFHESFCASQGLSSAELVMTCGQKSRAQSPRTQSIVGHCNENEMCFDIDHHGMPTAYCAYPPSYKVRAPYAPHGHARQLSLGPADRAGGQTMAVVLTQSKNPKELQIAQEIEITAMGRNNKPVAPAKVCFLCSRLTLQDTPAGTRDWMVQIIMGKTRHSVTVNGFAIYFRDLPPDFPGFQDASSHDLKTPGIES